MDFFSIWPDHLLRCQSKKLNRIVLPHFRVGVNWPEVTSCQKTALLDVSSAIFTEVPREVQPISITDPAQPTFYSCCYPPDLWPSKVVVLLLTEHCARAFHASGWMRNCQKGTHSDTVSDSTSQEICWDTQQIGHNLNLSVTGDSCMFIGLLLNNVEQQIQLWMRYKVPLTLIFLTAPQLHRTGHGLSTTPASRFILTPWRATQALRTFGCPIFCPCLGQFKS